MQFKQDNIWPVSGFKEPQDLGVDFDSGPVEQQMADGETHHFFSIITGGDIVVDDGHIHFASHSVELDVAKALELHGELYHWLTTVMEIHFNPIILAHLGKGWIPTPWELGQFDHEELAKSIEKIDLHDGTTDGRGRNTQDGNSSP